MLTSFLGVNLQVDLPAGLDQKCLETKANLVRQTFLGYQQEAIYAANNVISSVLELVFPFTWLVKLLRLFSSAASHWEHSHYTRHCTS